MPCRRGSGRGRTAGRRGRRQHTCPTPQWAGRRTPAASADQTWGGWGRGGEEERRMNTGEIMKLLVQAIVISQLDYCNSLLASLPACVIQPLQFIQNAVAHLVFNLPKFSHVTPLLRSLHWLPVAARIRFKVLTLAYAAANKTAPHFLQDIIQAYTPVRPLRSAATGRLVHPACRATVSRSSRLRSFSILAPQWWNDLPIPIRTAPSLPIFRRSLKTHLFTLYLDSSSGVP